MSECAIDWKLIDIVVFDVDGTLYSQRAMRKRMLRDLLGHTLASGSLATVRVLRQYRRLRELFGEEEVDGFEEPLISRTAEDVGIDRDSVKRIVNEWIERRPLAHIRACRYPHVDEVFSALRRHRKKIGIFSDYPAREKLQAMGLAAEFVVCATDENVGILKPHPRGLQALMAAAGTSACSTVLVGDREDRDGEAARRAGVHVLIRSASPLPGWACFEDFSAEVFRPLLEN